MNTTPTPKQNLIFGNALQFKPKDFHLALRKWADELGGVYKFRIITKDMYVVSSPAEIEYLLTNRPKKFSRSSKLSSILNEVSLNGLFTAEGSSWAKQKRLMTSSFSNKQLTTYFPKLELITNRLISHIKMNTTRLDMRNLFTRYTIDVTSSFSFGDDVNTIENSDKMSVKHLNFIFEVIGERVTKPFPTWRYIKTKKDRKLIESVSYIKNYVTEYIDKANKRMESTAVGSAPTNILEAMILAGRQEDHPFTNEELFGNVITLLLAGEDTTANVLSWCFFYLSQNPAILKELRESLAHLGKVSSMESLEDLPFLESVINETMRLKPVAPFLILENLEDTELSGHKISKNSTIVANISYNHFNSTYFESPYSFKPSRWLEQKNQNTDKVFIPFGSGARLCIGKKLSLLEMKLAIVEIVRSFDFKLDCAADEICEEFNFTLNPNKLPMIFSPL
ncbi:hypothetical protein A9Q84_18120 [Halobacteriovorax marinus]|uniref:Cytochrome P450 n=1 Tax=Halobacteriovorax marinus TaxID=97084 RepID=A0A1Y5F7C9_9BACT|nr:hypothetical protein A9Q84_18120 [Halobacteriovorax marinus]